MSHLSVPQCVGECCSFGSQPRHLAREIADNEVAQHIIHMGYYARASTLHLSSSFLLFAVVYSLPRINVLTT